jgi:SAM-dependent methyltransferase
MSIPSVLRLAEHRALSSITLSGKVLDLGGTKNAEYHSFLKGMFEVTTVNMDPKTNPDCMSDLEQPVPYPDASFNHVLLVNVLEHIFEYRQLLSEAERIVRPSGSVIIVVPFLFPIHADPHDFWRFSKETLQRECQRAGLTIETLTPLGSGVFSARHLFIARLMPGPVRFLLHHTTRYLAVFFDALFVQLARLLGKKYLPEEYALGYAVVATKP